MMSKPDMLGVYVHIPFCVQKCLYCDFLSFADCEEHHMAYKDALLNEIVHTPELRRDIDTVFIGGGTPSVLPPEFISEVLNALENLTVGAEITLEANPATVTPDVFVQYRNMGINRLSFGLQSTHDHELKSLGRIHDYDGFLDSYHAARTAGFDNISVDIMHSLPGQDILSWETTLKRVLALKPEHISAYGLTVEENTAFGRMIKTGELQEIDECLDREMYAMACGLLQSSGYMRYEISNFARNGFNSRHNTKYWTRAEYIGLGLGAHSLINETRFCNTNDLDLYISKKGLPKKIRLHETVITPAEAMAEFMFLGLRMANGVSAEEFYLSFGCELYSVYSEQIKKHVDCGLLIERDGRVFLSTRGVDVCNWVMAEFL